MCEYTAVTRNELKEHGIKEHQTDKMFQCSFCDFTSAHPTSIKEHSTRLHGQEFVKRKRRSKKTIKRTFDKDFDITDDGKYQCPFCPHASLERGNLLLHIRTIHELKKKFRCPLCDFSCVQKGALLAHVKSVHQKIKDHKCSQCDYKTAYFYNLRAHIKKHHGEQKYKCDQCPKTFGYKPNLVSHIKYEHEGVRKMNEFVCQKCDFLTFDKNEMSNHKRKEHPKNSKKKIDGCESKTSPNINEVLGRTRCSICKKSFNTPLGLKVHMSHMHSKKKKLSTLKVRKNKPQIPEKCPFCNEMFDPDGLNVHLKVAHEKEQLNEYDIGKANIESTPPDHSALEHEDFNAKMTDSPLIIADSIPSSTDDMEAEITEASESSESKCNQEHEGKKSAGTETIQFQTPRHEDKCAHVKWPHSFKKNSSSERDLSIHLKNTHKIEADITVNTAIDIDLDKKSDTDGASDISFIEFKQERKTMELLNESSMEENEKISQVTESRHDQDLAKDSVSKSSRIIISEFSISDDHLNDSSKGFKQSYPIRLNKTRISKPEAKSDSKVDSKISINNIIADTNSEKITTIDSSDFVTIEDFLTADATLSVQSQADIDSKSCLSDLMMVPDSDEHTDKTAPVLEASHEVVKVDHEVIPQFKCKEEIDEPEMNVAQQLFTCQWCVHLSEMNDEDMASHLEEEHCITLQEYREINCIS